MIVRLASELRGIVTPGIRWLRGATILEHEPALDVPLAEAEAAMRATIPPDVALPRLNTMVDVCNWCWMEFQLPYGLYDARRIERNTILRRLNPLHHMAGLHIQTARQLTGSGRRNHAVDLVWGLGTLHCLTQQEPAA